MARVANAVMAAFILLMRRPVHRTAKTRPTLLMTIPGIFLSWLDRVVSLGGLRIVETRVSFPEPEMQKTESSKSQPPKWHSKTSKAAP
jgi:hypothetical protein